MHEFALLGLLTVREKLYIVLEMVRSRKVVLQCNRKVYEYRLVQRLVITGVFITGNRLSYS